MTNINEQIWAILDEYLLIASSTDIYEKTAIKKIEEFLTNQNLQWTAQTIDIHYGKYSIISFAWINKDGTPNVETVVYI